MFRVAALRIFNKIIKCIRKLTHLSFTVKIRSQYSK